MIFLSISASYRDNNKQPNGIQTFLIKVDHCFKISQNNGLDGGDDLPTNELVREYLGESPVRRRARLLSE